MRAPFALPLLAVLALPARAEFILGPVTTEQAAAGRKELESHNGAGARGCMTERAAYEAYHRVQPGIVWNPDNPADWYLMSNTLGLIDGVILNGYGEISRQWNALHHGTDFAAIGAPCRAARTPRSLAACLNDSVRAYFAAHKDVHAVTGGDCKLYSATLVAVGGGFPAVTRASMVVASLQHAINKVEIRDAAGRPHLFLIDSLNNLVVALTDGQGACPDEGTLASASGAAAPPDEKAALERQKEAAARAAKAAGAAVR